MLRLSDCTSLRQYYLKRRMADGADGFGAAERSDSARECSD